MDVIGHDRDRQQLPAAKSSSLLKLIEYGLCLRLDNPNGLPFQLMLSVVVEPH
jgi:hypothetical protein